MVDRDYGRKPILFKSTSITCYDEYRMPVLEREQRLANFQCLYPG